MISAPVFSREAMVAGIGFGLVVSDHHETAELFDTTGSFERVAVETPLICSGADIQSVTLRSRGHWSLIAPSRREYWLEFTLRPAAAERLGECARRQNGARLALLLRNQVVGQIQLSGPITGCQFAWHGMGDKHGAETLLREIESALRAPSLRAAQR